jgi:hypothetical protein
MGLSNGAKKARNYSSIITQNQGGGDKKAGFPYQIGRESWTSIFLNTCDPASFTLNRTCCSLKDYNKTLVFATPSRPLGLRTGSGYGYPNSYMLRGAR